MGIVVIGAVFVDIKGYPEGSFIPGGRNAGRFEQTHGGVGRNVAEDIANTQLRPTFVGLVDQSGSGEDVVRKLKRHKVNTDYIRATRNGMGTWLAVFDSDGDVNASISQRPDLAPIGDILAQQGDEIIRDADSIILEIDMDHDIIDRTFALAKKYHKKVYGVVANMGIALQRREYFRSTDCFVCNRQEAGMMFGQDYSGTEPQEMARILARQIRDAGIPAMIVTLGAEGAVYASQVGEQGWCPAQKVEVRDTTGAGDAFCAGAAIGLTYGKGLAEACRIGTMLSASVITSSENVCPRFLPRQLGLDLEVED